MTAADIMFSLLRSEFAGTKISQDVLDSLNDDTLGEIFALSKKHDVVHTISKVLFSALKIENAQLSENFKKAQIRAIFRDERISWGIKKVYALLEEAKIDFILLKGAILRDYYSETWLRTCADIDVLVREEDLFSASECFRRLGYKTTEKGTHDISVYAPNGLHIEIHYTLNEVDLVKKSHKVFDSVWSYATKKEGYSHFYALADEMFYAYHIAHMAKHFEAGGCGIRPFIDLLILNGNKTGDGEKCNALLKKSGLLEFAGCAEKLSRVWFCGEQHTALTKKMEDYILVGGVYGTSTNQIFVQQQQKGGKFKYFLSKVFLPYDILKFHYPILQKYRFLTPIMEIRRWGKLMFCGHMTRVSQTMKYNDQISDEQASEMKRFLNEIGL